MNHTMTLDSVPTCVRDATRMHPLTLLGDFHNTVPYILLSETSVFIIMIMEYYIVYVVSIEKNTFLNTFKLQDVFNRKLPIYCLETVMI